MRMLILALITLLPMLSHAADTEINFNNVYTQAQLTALLLDSDRCRLEAQEAEATPVNLIRALNQKAEPIYFLEFAPQGEEPKYFHLRTTVKVAGGQLVAASGVPGIGMTASGHLAVIPLKPHVQPETVEANLEISDHLLSKKVRYNKSCPIVQRALGPA